MSQSIEVLLPVIQSLTDQIDKISQRMDQMRLDIIEDRREASRSHLHVMGVITEMETRLGIKVDDIDSRLCNVENSVRNITDVQDAVLDSVEKTQGLVNLVMEDNDLRFKQLGDRVDVIEAKLAITLNVVPLVSDSPVSSTPVKAAPEIRPAEKPSFESPNLEVISVVRPNPKPNIDDNPGDRVRAITGFIRRQRWFKIVGRSKSTVPERLSADAAPYRCLVPQGLL